MGESDQTETRRCPGERYDIPLAICQARQANHFPKCLLCKHSGGRSSAESFTTDAKVKPEIFRTIAVAGEVPSEINPYVVRKIGTAAAQFLRTDISGAATMVVASDLRDSSRSLARVFCEGANVGGMNTVSIGAAPPELLRYTLSAQKLHAGAFVGGCHGPENRNGIRLYGKDGAPLTFETGLDKVGLIARRVRPGRSRSPGHSDARDPLPAYRSYLRKFAPRLKPSKMVLDGSCGIAGGTAPRVFSGLPIELTTTNSAADGRSPFLGRKFPSAEVRSAVSEAIRSAGADFGAAVDFDGDMVAFFDETGSLLRHDVAADLIAGEMLARTPGARIAYDLRFSAAVREDISKIGGHALACAADPVALSDAVRRKEAIYAADMAGRHFFRDLFGAESPMLAMLLVCSLLSRRSESLSEMAKDVARYVHTGEKRFEMPSAEIAAQALDEVKTAYSASEADTLDGLTVRSPDWWFNLRLPAGSASLRLNVEGRNGADERRARLGIEKIVRNHQARKPS